MASVKERVTGLVSLVRQRVPLADHLVRTVLHYNRVNGNAQAGAVTFFGFLSFFPVLAIGFFVVGYISAVYPDARENLVDALDAALPGIVGDGEGEIPISTFERNASTVGLIGLVGVLYSGLGWLSGMRDALEVMFELPQREQPNFVFGKLRDLAALVLIGSVLVISVALSSTTATLSETILRGVGVYDVPGVPVIVVVAGYALAIGSTTVLLLAFFRFLAKPHLPRAAVVQGAVIGAVGFEILKRLASFLITTTKDQPAFQAFGIALILVVWINYFSRLVMYSAAWAYTAPAAADLRAAEATYMPGAALTAPSDTADPEPPPEQRST